VSQPADPRVLRFVAGVRIGNRWVRLCHGTSSCTGTLPPGADPEKVGTVNVDVWHRRSAASFTLALRQR
jgi:hypothetical protein